MNLPKEVIALRDAVLSIPGINNVRIDHDAFGSDDIERLDGVFWNGPYADLPICALRRSDGNLDEEILVSVHFQVTPNEIGLAGLEFLSWWVRDVSRSGGNYQIRSIGLPPLAGESIQLGNTLRFSMDMFIRTERESMSEVLVKLGAEAESIQDGVEFNEGAFAAIRKREKGVRDNFPEKGAEEI